MTIVEKVVTALYEGSDDRAFADHLATTIYNYLDQRRIRIDGHWKDVIEAINAQLRFWLLNQSRGRTDDRFNRKLHAARNSLALPDRESYIDFWLADIRLDYAPVAHSLF